MRYASILPRLSFQDIKLLVNWKYNFTLEEDVPMKDGKVILSSETVQLLEEDIENISNENYYFEKVHIILI